MPQQRVPQPALTHVHDGQVLLESLVGEGVPGGGALLDEQPTSAHLGEERVCGDLGAQAPQGPIEGRIRGGYTECFLPGEPVDLDDWIDHARRELASSPQARSPMEASKPI